jgi:hypothetical protein
VENRVPSAKIPFSMRTSLKLLAAIAIAIAAPAPILAGSPPPDLVKLEKLVSLELAHVRDNGPIDDAKRKRLFTAKQLQQKGEDAIKSGDYKSAEDSLLQARVILRQLAE